MKLLHLRIACYLYNRLTDSDRDYLILLENYPDLDLSETEHVKALIKWLRSWGCRQFKKDDEHISINSIRDWYDSNIDMIPSRNDCLIDYALGANQRSIIKVFDNLSKCKASTKQLSDLKIDVHIGPVGSAKILFSLRPNLFSPWDTAIYRNFNLNGSGSSYVKFLLRVQDELKDLKNSLNDTDWNNLFEYLNTNHNSYPKLVDEYYWVTITRGCDPPAIERFLQ